MTWKLVLLCVSYGISTGIGLFGGFELLFSQRSLDQAILLIIIGLCGLTSSALLHLILVPTQQHITFHLPEGVPGLVLPKGIILRADTATYITTREWHPSLLRRWAHRWLKVPLPTTATVQVRLLVR